MNASHKSKPTPKTKKRKRDKKPASANVSTPELTPTQARNARKRRTKQKKNQASSNSSDPSTQYLKNPTNTPVIVASKSYFHTRNVSYKVHISPLSLKGGWRTVCKFPVRRHGKDQKGNGKVIIGMFSPKSHEVVTSGSNCIAHHPSINRTITILERACEKCDIIPYDEKTGEGILRYVCINVERSTGKVQITLIPSVYESTNSELEKLLEHLIAKMDGELSLLHSLWIHPNTAWKHSNAIFDINGNQWILHHGPKAMQEVMVPEKSSSSTVTLFFPPNVFRQANLEGFLPIILKIQERILLFNSVMHKKCRLLELYGGVGTIGLHMVDLCASYICSDENPHNEKCFKKSIKSLCSSGEKPKKKNKNDDCEKQQCQYIPKNALDMVLSEKKILQNCDVIIVDPPRKGLEKEVVSILGKKSDCRSAKLLVYVSCGFRAFQRDCDLLLNSEKGWKLESAQGYVLFPGSDAVETLAFFVAE